MRTHIIYIFTLLILLSACSQNADEGKVDEQTQPATILFQFPQNRGGNADEPNETSVNRVRIVMFKVSSNQFALNKFFDPLVSNTVRFDSYTGNYDIYIIVNEPLNNGAEMPAYKGIKTRDDIKALQLEYSTPSTSPYVPSDIPMFNIINNQQINKDNTISVEVERVMAKVYVDLNVAYADFAPNEHVTITSVTLKQLPTRYNWISTEYIGDSFVSSETQTLAATNVSGVDTYNHVFYVPEYILQNNAGTNTVIEVKGLVEDLGIECLWTEPLGDKMDMNSTKDKYDIRRNTQYQLIGNIKGYGQHDLYVTTKIEDWIVVDLGDELN